MYRFTEGFGDHLTEGRLWVRLFAQRTLSHSVSQSLEVGTITISLHGGSENYKDSKVTQLVEPPLRPPKAECRTVLCMEHVQYGSQDLSRGLYFPL